MITNLSYVREGIPYRRGYLLHGKPGSGKTSLIYSLAGELGLDIYVLNLSSKGMDNNTLMKLMKNVPPQCILLFEDLDAAFTYSITANGNTTANTNAAADQNGDSALNPSDLVTSLDWVAEGQLLFATTNHVERLDPALSRPGRMDVWVKFTDATKSQAESIFKHFFSPPRPFASSPIETPTPGAPRENLAGAWNGAPADAVVQLPQ